MRSIAHAMLWEFFRRIRWSAPAFLVLAMSFWMVPSRQVPLDVNNHEFLLFYFIWSLISIGCVVAGLTIAQTPVSALYTTPISTPVLVAWKQFIPSIAVGIVVAMGFGAANQFYGLDLPILGISLFACTMAAALFLVNSQYHNLSFWNSGWAGLAITVALICWFKCRYGDFDSIPEHLWTNVTLGEFVTLLGTVGLSYAIAVRSVAASRCSEEIGLALIRRWLERFRCFFVSRAEERRLPFSSPSQAQVWYEYRQKGAAFPVGSLLLTLLFLIPFLIHQFLGYLGLIKIGPPDVRLVDVLCQGFYAFGFAFSFIGLLTGVVMGFADLSGSKQKIEPSLNSLFNPDDRIRMGSFQATLPLAPRSFASAILRTAIQSIVITWCIWGLFFIGFLVATSNMKPSPISRIDLEEIGLWYLPLTLLGPWIIVANVATIGLTGRNRLVISLVVSVPLLFFGFFAATGSIESTAKQELIMTAALVSLLLIILAGTLIAFGGAWHMKLIGYSSILLGVVMSLMIAGLAIYFAPMELFSTAYLMIAAFAALVVLPIATAPLAIAWNRNR